MHDDGTWTAVLPDGTRLPWDDGRKKTLDEALASPDLEDTLARPYRRGPIRAIVDPGDDPGRVRVDALFRVAYPRAGITTLHFFGHRLRVHAKVVAPLERVAARLRAIDVGPWMQKLSGTLVVRNIAGTTRPSSHSYGISLDLDSARTQFWRWDRPPHWHNTVPQAIVDAFEAEGFIWGGRWYHYDTMHFEYRPELLDPACELR
ncbi:MAG: M15 family metallopeptidase [Polyangia bacterium]